MQFFELFAHVLQGKSQSWHLFVPESVNFPSGQVISHVVFSKKKPDRQDLHWLLLGPVHKEQGEVQLVQSLVEFSPYYKSGHVALQVTAFYN